MVECEYCEREMSGASSCTFNRVIIDNELFDRIKYDCSMEACPDCAVSNKGVHHYGCDNEECPSCIGQLISCDCFIEAIIDDENRKIIKFTDRPGREYIELVRRSNKGGKKR